MNDSQDWQSAAALLVVLATLTLFVTRSVLRRKKGKSAGLGCASGGCGCGPKLGKKAAGK